MTGEGESPRKPGWYPHRYDIPGLESYWNGSEWTGDSRAKRSPVSLRPLARWVGYGVALGTVMLIITAIVGGGVVIGNLVILVGLWSLGLLPLPRFKRIESRIGSSAIFIVALTTTVVFLLGIAYLIDV